MRVLKPFADPFVHDGAKFTGRRILLILSGILALAFALRMGRALEIDRIEEDAVSYINMAREIADHGLAGSFRANKRLPPLYILLMAAGESVGIGAERSGVLISVLCGSLLVVPVFLIARRLCSVNVALLAALLAATQPNLVRISAEILRDPAFYFFSTAGVCLIVEHICSGRKTMAFSAGIMVSLATMTRSEGMEILVALAAWSFLETLLACVPLSAARMREIGRKIIATGFALIIFTAGFWAATIPVQRLMKPSVSEWRIVDMRMVGYLKGLFFNSPDDIYEQQNQ